MLSDFYYMFRPFFYPLEVHFEQVVKEHNLNPLQIAILSSFSFIIILWVLRKLTKFLIRLFGIGSGRSLQARLFKFAITYLPFLRNKFDKEITKAKNDFLADMTKYYEDFTYKIPKVGQSSEKLQEQIKKWNSRDEKFSNTGKVSGTRYCKSQHEESIKQICADFLFHNPLHASEFPASRQMESELVSMTGHLFSQKEPIGYMTSGGTESIMMGILAHRNYYKEKKGIKKPNIVLPATAHVAFHKACEYYNIEVQVIEVDPVTKAADVRAMAKAVNKNTVCLVGSCPQFPHGIVDDIPSLGKVALKNGIGLHVDCCLGSFIVPFANKLGSKIPDFDFRVPGVTSISCDHHKYGMAPKGVSIVMYKSVELKHSTYFGYTTWSGGLYATQSSAGSRCAAPSVGAWYAMKSLGAKGYEENAKRIIGAVKELKEEINKIDSLEVIGDPMTCAIAFTFKKNVEASIYCVEVAMHERGWVLAAIQKPPAIHISMTISFVDSIKVFIKDLKDIVPEVLNNPTKYTKNNKGSVGLYGTSAQIKDSTVMKDILCLVVDSFTAQPHQQEKEKGEKQTNGKNNSGANNSLKNK